MLCKPIPDPVVFEPDNAASRRCSYLSRTHPLASVAAQHCAWRAGRSHLDDVGGVACGACGERAIRDDEPSVAEFGLPRELTPHPGYGDEIAAEFPCRGERRPLTAVERAEAVRRVSAAGVGPGAIGGRLGLSDESVRGILAGLAEAIDLVPTVGPALAATADDETAVA
jgi:hypothetical protein